MHGQRLFLGLLILWGLCGELCYSHANQENGHEGKSPCMHAAADNLTAIILFTYNLLFTVKLIVPMNLYLCKHVGRCVGMYLHIKKLQGPWILHKFCQISTD